MQPRSRGCSLLHWFIWSLCRFRATSYRPESKTLVRGATSASRRIRADRLAHQIEPRRGCAGLGIVTSAAERAAVAGPTNILGLGSVAALLQAIHSSRRGCSSITALNDKAALVEP